jgi:transducin (beta)-like 1
LIKVWDLATSEIVSVFEGHQSSLYDGDWKNNTQFATCSADTNIHIWNISQPNPIQTFSAHKDEVII